MIQGLSSTANKAPMLSLSLRNCRNVGNASMRVVAEMLPGLRNLCTYGVCPCTPHLWLTPAGTFRISDDGLVMLGVHGRSIERLNTSGCYKITDGCIRYMLNTRPTLLIYNNPEDWYKTEWQ